MRLEDSGVEPVWDQNRPAWDETSAPGISGEFHGISGADRFSYAAIAVVSLGVGICQRALAAHDAAGRGAAYDLRTPLFWEISSILVIILVAPVLFIAVRRMNHVSGWPIRVALAGVCDCRVLQPAHRRHGRASQASDVHGRQFLRLSPRGRDRDLRIPQGRHHLPVDRRLVVADRQPPRGAPGRRCRGGCGRPATGGRAVHGLASRRHSADPYRT